MSSEKNKTNAGTVRRSTTDAVQSAAKFVTPTEKKHEPAKTSVASGSLASTPTIIATYDAAKGFRTGNVQVPFDAKRAERQRENLSANQATRKRVDTSTGD